MRIIVKTLVALAIIAVIGAAIAVAVAYWVFADRSWGQGAKDERRAVGELSGALDRLGAWPVSEAAFRSVRFEIDGHSTDVWSAFPPAHYDVVVQDGPDPKRVIVVHSRATQRIFILTKNGTPITQIWRP